MDKDANDMNANPRRADDEVVSEGKPGDDIVSEESSLEEPLSEEYADDEAPARPAQLPAKPAPALLALLGLLLLGGLGLVLWGLLFSGAGPGSGPAVVPSAQALLTPGVQLDPKLATILLELQKVYVRDGAEAARKFAESRLLIEPDGMIRLTVELDTEEKAAHDKVAQQLEVWGVKIDNRNRMSMDVSFTVEQVGAALAIPTVGAGTPIAIPTSLTGGDLPPSILNGMANLEHVVKVRQVLRPETEEIQLYQIRPEGVAKTGADTWHKQGITGKGIKIGVLDPDGFYGYKEMLGQELPPADKVHVQAFNASKNIEGDPRAAPENRWHGAACAEIVSAMAPDAELYLASFDTDGSLEKAVDWLTSQGVNIISASFGSNYFATDGKTSASTLLVEKTARENNILWVISSGNEANDHYKGTFKAGPDGVSTLFYNGQARLKAEVGAGNVRIILRWDDWAARNIDYTFLLLDENGNEIASSRDVQRGGPQSYPIELINFRSEGRATYYLAITAPQGTRGVNFDIFKSGPIELEKYVASGSLGTPGDAASGLTVGAVNWQSEQITDYSSQGPTDDGRIKPDIAAHSDMSSRTYKRMNEVFSGTSASAPLAAGGAALVWSANRNFTVEQVKAFMMQRSVDSGDPGPDSVYGTGRMAMGASPNAEPITPPQPPAPIDPVQPAPPLQPGAVSSSNSALVWVLVGGIMMALAAFAGIGIWLLMRSRARAQPAYAMPGAPGQYGQYGPNQYGQYPYPPPQQHPPGYYPGQTAQGPPGQRPPVPPQPGQGWPMQVPPGQMPPGQRPPMPGVNPGAPAPQAGMQPPAPRPPFPQPQAPGQPRPPLPPMPGGAGQVQGMQGIQPPPPMPGGFAPPSPQPPVVPPQAGAMQPQPPAPGSGGRPLPPPPRPAALCPNCARMLKPGAAQCDNCGWKKP